MMVKAGISWVDGKTLSDLDFADDMVEIWLKRSDGF